MGALMASRNLEPCWAAPQGKALQHQDGQLYFVEVERDADKNLEQRQANLHPLKRWCIVAEFLWCTFAANLWCIYTRGLTNVEISTRPVLGGRL